MIMSTVDSHVAARLVADSIRHDECMWHAAGGMGRWGDGYLLTMCHVPASFGKTFTWHSSANCVASLPLTLSLSSPLFSDLYLLPRQRRHLAND